LAKSRIELCNFSGLKIYPGHGKLYVRSDSRVFRFLNAKCESYSLQRLKPAKLDWTIVFRRLHKKGQDELNSKKRAKKHVKVQRAVVGASLDAIKQRREMNPVARAAERKSQIDAIKATKAKSNEAKKQEQAKVFFILK
jgi:large subunit ribosomal protein L24e